ncbi:MAG: hypothetical protein ACJASB_001960 [Shewanella psychromarinicola]|jgi:hypothetical protein
MYAAMKHLHKPVNDIERENGDHNVSNNQHLLRKTSEIEHFLATNLGVK